MEYSVNASLVEESYLNEDGSIQQHDYPFKCFLIINLYEPGQLPPIPTQVNFSDSQIFLLNVETI